MECTSKLPYIALLPRRTLAANYLFYNIYPSIMWVKPEAGFSEMLKIYSGSQAGKDIASVMTHWTKTKSRLHHSKTVENVYRSCSQELKLYIIVKTHPTCNQHSYLLPQGVFPPTYETVTLYHVGFLLHICKTQSRSIIYIYIYR